MGRAPCCDKANVKRGPWAPEEDAKLKEYIEKHGTGGNWISLPKRAGLKRCGKSCRLRWLNYLRPNLKHGDFSDDEDRIIYTLFATIGSRWSIIAAQLPGRTDNDIKNYWNTKLKKKLMAISDIDPSIYNYYFPKSSSKPQPQSITQFSSSSSSSSSSSVLSYSSNNMNSYYTSAPSSFSQTLLMMNNSGNNNNDSIMQHYQVNDNVLVFGGGDRHLQTSSTSGSSSDGSINNNNNNQIIIKQENNQLDCHQHQYDYGQMGNLQNYCNYYNGYDEDQNHQKLTVPPEERYHHDLEHQQKSPLLLDYGLEEIKQLISTDNCNSINNILL